MCRGFGQGPDDVRRWEYSDYVAALESICEIPVVDEAVFYGFLKPSDSGGSTSRNQVKPLATKADRDQALKELSASKP